MAQRARLPRALKVVGHEHAARPQLPRRARAAVAALENINTLGFQDKKVGFMLNVSAARWFDGPLDDAEQKVIFAKKALAIGSDDAEMIAMLNKLIG